MLRSLYSAISALNLQQSYLDIIADNLANVNTTGFKATRATFQSQYSQLISPGSTPTAAIGGVNPTQIGLGVRMGYISPIFTQGALQATGRSSDLAIQGDGFFIYRNGAANVFSREGGMETDANGYLVNGSTGLRIQGWSKGINDKTINTNDPIGDIQTPLGTLAKSTTAMEMTGNLDATVFDPNNPTLDKNGDPTVVNSTAGVYDSLGNLHVISYAFARTGTNKWTWTASRADDTAVPPATLGTGDLTFTSTGQFDPANSTADPKITVPMTNGADPVEFTVDLTRLTMLSTASSVTASAQNGLAAGSVTDLYVTPGSGEIYLVYSNGLKDLVAQLAMSRFTNPTGLIRSGNNLYRVGLNSGEPQIGTAASGGRGTLVSAYLEGSNVDMAQEFTNMILAQRGFQASTRMVTTSDEVLSELVNLKR